MNDMMKAQVAFMAASLIELADMTETNLQDAIEVVGTDAIQELMGMDHLRYECGYERMAEEICNYIGWDPMLVMPWRDDGELDKIGLLIADLVEDKNPTDEEAADSLVSALNWDGLWAWLECNVGEESV